MKLEFDSVEELFAFIKEIESQKVQIVRAMEAQKTEGILKENEDPELITKDLTAPIQTIKECPYGFIQCPYTRDIPTYYPYKITSNDLTNSNVTVDLKDIKNENNT